MNADHRPPSATRRTEARYRAHDRETRRSRSDSAQPPVACVLAWRCDRKLDAVAAPSPNEASPARRCRRPDAGDASLHQSRPRRRSPDLRQGASARRRCGHLRERPAHARCRRTRSLRNRSRGLSLRPSVAEASNQPVGALGVVPSMRRWDAVADARSPRKAKVVVSMISTLSVAFRDGSAAVHSMLCGEGWCPAVLVIAAIRAGGRRVRPDVAGQKSAPGAWSRRRRRWGGYGVALIGSLSLMRLGRTTVSVREASG